MNRLYTSVLAAWFFSSACLAAGTPALPDFCPPLPTAPVPSRADVPYGSGLLWRVSRAGVAPSFLLGTMHISDPRVTAIATVVDSAMSRSTRFAMEVVLDIEAAMTLQGAMFFPDGRSLRQLAGGPLFELTARHLGVYGIPPAIAENLKPWAAFTTLSMPAGDVGLPLDVVLMMSARAAGKEVVGLESVEEQISLFESLPEADQIEMLREVACHFDKFQEELETMVELYDDRDLAGLLRLTLLHMSDEKLAFLDTLLWERNARMVERMAPLLESGQAFIAVGALHLPGTGGILERLTDRGFAVEAIY